MEPAGARAHEIRLGTGRDWPLVIAKESVDNALDAARGSRGRADITVDRRSGHDRRQDNAGGIAAETIEGVLDYDNPGVVSRGLRFADPRRRGQRAQDHPRHGLRARPRKRRDAAGVTTVESRGVSIGSTLASTTSTTSRRSSAGPWRRRRSDRNEDDGRMADEGETRSSTTRRPAD